MENKFGTLKRREGEGIKPIHLKHRCEANYAAIAPKENCLDCAHLNEVTNYRASQILTRSLFANLDAL